MVFPKTIRLCAALLTACALFTGCAARNPAPQPSGFPASAASEAAPASSSLSPQGVYTDPDKSFQVTIPDGYQEDSTLSDEDRAVFLSPSGTRSVELKKLGPDCNLLAYSKAEFTKTYDAAFTDFQLQNFQSITAGDHPGVALRFTCQKRGETYTVAQYVLAGDSDYSVTYAAIDGDEDFFALAEESIRTFRELNPETPTPLAGRLSGTSYTDRENRYTVTLPSGWKIDKQTDEGVVFQSGDQKSNINIQWGQADKQLLRYQKSYFTEYFQDALGSSAQITVFQSGTVSGKNARYLECTYTRSGQALLSKQYLLNSDAVTYRITFTSAAADADKVKFAEVAKSFRLIEN